MSVLGFNFTKIMTERKSQGKGKINISNNVTIADVKEAKLNLGSDKQMGLEISFKFKSTYDPDIGTIELEGYVIFMESAEKVKEILASWKKEGKVPPDAIGSVYNTILTKCNV